MNIFYGKSAGRTDVPSESSVSASLDMALEVFRGLELRRGFMGIVLDGRHVIHLSPRKNGKINVELLDRSIPAFDECDKDAEFAEFLIRAAAAGQDVFAVARAAGDTWEHLDLSCKATAQEDPVVVALRLQQARLAAIQGPPKPVQSATYPMASIASGDQAGFWVSIGFSSPERKSDVLHIVGGSSKSPIYLERYDQSLSCYQGAERIEVKPDSIMVTLNLIGQMTIGLPAILHFVSNKNNDRNLMAATEMFAKMKQFESGSIIELQQPKNQPS